MRSIKLRLLKNQIINSGPSHVILHVTNRCNLRCKTCFVDTNSVSFAEEISLADIRTIANRLKNLIFTDIGGGEPFLRNDLIDICSSFKTTYLSIPTNGFDPDGIYHTVAQIRKRTEAALTISVSLDGFEKTNDDIRGAGSFQKALQTFSLLKSVPGIHLKINTVLSNRNYDEIINFMGYIRTLNPDFHSLNFLRGNPRSATLTCPSSGELRDIKKDVLGIWKSYSYGLTGFDKIILRNYHENIYESSLKVMEAKRQVPSCLAFKHHLVVYPNGDASFCEMLKPFGNLLEKPLTAWLKEENTKQRIKMIRSGDCCCYHNCNLIDNYFLNIFQYHKLFKLFT